MLIMWIASVVGSIIDSLSLIAIQLCLCFYFPLNCPCLFNIILNCHFYTNKFNLKSSALVPLIANIHQRRRLWMAHLWQIQLFPWNVLSERLCEISRWEEENFAPSERSLGQCLRGGVLAASGHPRCSTNFHLWGSMPFWLLCHRISWRMNKERGKTAIESHPQGDSEVHLNSDLPNSSWRYA